MNFLDNVSHLSMLHVSKSGLSPASLHLNKCLNIFSINFRSLKNKYKIFNAFLISNNIDIFIGCETFLDDSISDVMISNDHKIYKKNRSSHGGVILGLRKGINHY